MASGYSNGSGGAITDWRAFEAWASGIEGAEVEAAIERGLTEAATAHHPAAPGYAPIEVLVGVVGAVGTRVPEGWRMRIARFSGEASRALREGRCTPEARSAARALLEQPLRELLGFIAEARRLLTAEAA